MADRLWGANPTNEDLPFGQTYGAFAPSLGVGNGAGGNIDAGSYTMPWAGNLTVTGTGVLSWNGHQQASIHMYASTPAPNSSSFFSSIAHSRLGGLREQVPVYASWLNLAKGTTVNFRVYLGVGGGGPTVTFEWFGETIRAWPS